VEFNQHTFELDYTLLLKITTLMSHAIT